VHSAIRSNTASLAPVIEAGGWNALAQRKPGESLKANGKYLRRFRQTAGRILTLALAAGALSVSGTAQALPPALQLSRTIVLSGVSGKFDHLAIDAAGHRLFIAATGNHSVEVIDLKTDKVEQSIAGMGKPHGLAWVAATGSLYVADGSLGELRVYHGSPLTLAGKIKLSDDADDMVYDAADRLLFVGHGGIDAANPANVAVVSTEPFGLVANLPVATHPEALEIDPQSRRVFANIADSNEVAVIDIASKAITARWKLTKAAENVPLAFDGEHQLLYVACRRPGTLIALDAASGKEVAGLPAAAGADDLFYDPALKRVYVISGPGEVDAYQVDEAKTLHTLGVLHTAAGAKTALFFAAQNLLYVGVPGVDGHAAQIRVYRTVNAGERQ
jgi:DNA-binding beta-propeller fold protein YncE